jgi:hypothetical protein
MRRHSLLALLPITLLGLVVAATGAMGEVPPVKKGGEDNLLATRSDGSVVKMRPPDQKEVQKLVGYIRDGMSHADRWSKQHQGRKVLRPARKR